MVIERKQQHEQLLDDWIKARPEYNQNGVFTKDGPSNWEVYFNEKPRILFLLKEPWFGYRPDDWNYIYGQKGYNQVRWAYIIQQLYENPASTIALPSDIELKRLYNGDYSRIAEVEVKKVNHEQSASSDGEIFDYAARDAAYLQRQINLIDPQVIICCGTFSSFWKIFEDDFNQKIPLQIGKTERAYRIRDLYAWKHQNRLVLDFYHPSHGRIPGGINTYTKLLCELLNHGDIFNQFIWK
jgi:hypothetical protein